MEEQEFVTVIVTFVDDIKSFDNVKSWGIDANFLSLRLSNDRMIWIPVRRIEYFDVPWAGPQEA